MNNDLWIVCNVAVDPFRDGHAFGDSDIPSVNNDYDFVTQDTEESAVSQDTTDTVVLVAWVVLIVLAVAIVSIALGRIVKILKSKSNRNDALSKNSMPVENKQVDLDTQKGDNNQLK